MAEDLFGAPVTPPPLNVAPAPAATTAPQWSRLQDMGPLLALLPIAIAKGGRAGVAALLHGFQQGRQQSAQAGLQTAQYASQQAILDQNEQYRRDALAQQSANQDATRRQAFLQSFTSGLSGLDSEAAVNAFLALYGPQGQSVGIDRSALDALALETVTPTRLQRRQAEQTLEKAVKTYGLEQASQMSFVLQEGEPPVPFAEVQRMAGAVGSPSAAPIRPDLSRSGLDVQLADAKRRKARGEQGAADDVRLLEETILQADTLRRDPPRITVNTGVPGALPPNVQRLVDAKAKGFDAQPITKTTQKMAEAVAFSDSLDINTTNPADDIGLLYAFAKANDPDSVVREGEYATVQKYAQSWAEQFRFNAQRIFSNTQFLTPQARANMKSTIRKRYQAGKSQYDAVRRSYAQQINKITRQPDGESYLIDYASGFPDAPQAQPTPTPKPTEAERRRRGLPPSAATPAPTIGRFTVEVEP